jgi:hypothetical protein
MADKIALSLFLFAIIQAFTLSLFIKESYKGNKIENMD